MSQPIGTEDDAVMPYPGYVLRQLLVEHCIQKSNEANIEAERDYSAMQNVNLTEDQYEALHISYSTNIGRVQALREITEWAKAHNAPIVGAQERAVTTKDFEEMPTIDSDELAKGEKHVRPTKTTAHVAVPEGNWVDVPNGMVVAPGTYVDSEGVLRDANDHSCVVWHLSARRDGTGGCDRKGIQPNEIIYSVEGAPWCPDCWERNMIQGEMEKERKRIRAMFTNN